MRELYYLGDYNGAHSPVLQTLYLSAPQYAGIAIWVLSVYLLGRAFALRRRDRLVIIASVLVGWDLPIIMEWLSVPWFQFIQGHSIVVCGAIVAVCCAFLSWGEWDKVKRMACSLLLFFPVSGATIKIFCFFWQCCMPEDAVAFGSMCLTRPFVWDWGLYDPVQLYSSLGLLGMQGIFLALFDRWGMSFRLVASMLSLLAFHHVTTLFFGDGWSASRLTCRTLLHHPATGLLILLGMVLLLWKFRHEPQGQRFEFAVHGIDSGRKRWGRSLHAALVVALTLAAIQLAAKNEAYRQVPEMAHGEVAGLDAYPFVDAPRSCAPLVVSYRRFSGVYEWRPICLFLHDLYTRQSSLGPLPEDVYHIPLGWYKSGYALDHVEDLLDAYRMTGRPQYVETAVEDIWLWLRMIQETPKHGPLWPQNARLVAERARNMATVLGMVRHSPGPQMEAFRRLVSDRILFYAEYLARHESDAHREEGLYVAGSMALAAFACLPEEKAADLFSRAVDAYRRAHAAASVGPVSSQADGRRLARQLSAWIEQNPSALSPDQRAKTLSALSAPSGACQ